MNLLHAGVDSTVIALWLGHESVETTQIYLHADMAIKERALALRSLGRLSMNGGPNVITGSATRSGRSPGDETLVQRRHGNRTLHDVASMLWVDDATSGAEA
jgi:hypothetical protein